jgi:hypothetical protein
MPFRDTKTGRFVSESTWKRSQARGGKRYKRILPRRKKKKLLSRGVRILAGYQGRGNSYTLMIVINTHRPIARYDDEQLFTLVEKLAQAGHFDKSPNNPHPDLQWVSFNDYVIVDRDVDIAPGHALLEDFYRVSPEGILP